MYKIDILSIFVMAVLQFDPSTRKIYVRLEILYFINDAV